MCNNPTRAPSPLERAILERFKEAQVLSKTEFTEQIAVVQIGNVSEGFIDLVVPESAPLLQSYTGFPLNGWYQDRDGALVNLLLHATFPPGQIHELERYRIDGWPIQTPLPNPKDILVQPMPPKEWLEKPIRINPALPRRLL